MYNPLVSIIIPVFNGSNYLAEAIESAISQTYKNIEIIVINDGSNDNGASESIALSYSHKIKYYSKDNGGVSSALNLGIEKMSGEWFSWLSHDDMYVSNKVEIQINKLNEEINNLEDYHKCIIIGNTQFINKDSIKIPRYQKKLIKSFYSGLEMLLEVFSGYSIGGCTLLINRKIFDLVGNFNTELRYMQDTEMWYRCMLFGCKFFYVKEKIVLSRVHSTQITITSKNLGNKDSMIVGKWLSEKLINKYVKNKYLLLEYYYIALRRRAIVTVKLIENQLRIENKYNRRVMFKSILISAYANLRPTLVSIYYYLVNSRGK